jgi:hypothetical protein
VRFHRQGEIAMLRKIVTGLVAAAVVAGTTLAATSAADAQPYWYWKHHPHPHYYGYGYNDNGAAVAAGIFGLIGGLALSQLGHQGYGYPGYCEAHFRTYNPYTHQYMGYDGHPHYCYD